MSVTLFARKLLGSDLTAERIAHDVSEALLNMDDDAEEMGVRVDWSTVRVRVGEDYEEDTFTLTRQVASRRPYLDASVNAEKRTQ